MMSIYFGQFVWILFLFFAECSRRMILHDMKIDDIIWYYMCIGNIGRRFTCRCPFWSRAKRLMTWLWSMGSHFLKRCPTVAKVRCFVARCQQIFIIFFFFFFFFFFNFSAEYGTCSLYLVWLGHGTIVFPSDKKRCSCRSLNTAGWWLQDLWSGGVVVQGNFPLGFSGWFPNLFSREVEVASQKFCQKTGWRKSKPK